MRGLSVTRFLQRAAGLIRAGVMVCATVPRTRKACRSARVAFILLFTAMTLPGVFSKSIWYLDLGGSGIDYASSVTGDRDTLFVASYLGSDDAGVEHQGGIDVMVSRVSMEGEVIWSRGFGGTGDDDPAKILVHPDGSVVVIGTTSSNDGIFTGNHGGNDGFVLKLDRQGEPLWSRLIGGEGEESLLSGAITPAGDIIVAGMTNSDSIGRGNHGNFDCFLARITATGEMVWQNAYGGSFNETFRDVAMAGDSLILACGHTRSGDQDMEDFRGTPGGRYNNGLVMLLDTGGTILQHHCHVDADLADYSFTSLCMTRRGKIIVGGHVSILEDLYHPGDYHALLMEFSLTDGLSEIYRNTYSGYLLNQVGEEMQGNLFLVLGIGSVSRVLRLDSAYQATWSLQTNGAIYLGAFPVWDGSLVMHGFSLRCYCPVYYTTREVWLCQGESILIGDSLVTGPARIDVQYNSANGCDSTIYYYVEEVPSYHTEITLQGLCNDTLIFHDSLITETGIYLFPFTTEHGCDSTYSYNLEITQVTGEVVAEGGTLTAVQEGAAYTWYDCSDNQPIPGETGRSYTPAAPGSYRVRVELNGCDESSECTRVESTFVPGMDREGVAVYPNPVRSTLVISSPGQEIRSIRVTDMTGMVQLEVARPGNRLEADLSSLAPGLYLLRVHAGTGISMHVIMKE